jgi:uncharacterized phage protein (TIGR01671 family)
MREIKFRGWDADNKCWQYGYYTKLPDGITKFDYIISDIDGSLTKFYIYSYKTITQYIGLKDKNGKEIYEGDILKDDLDLYVVKFIDGWFMGVAFSNKYKWCISSELSEVVGNQYENPNLLEQLNEKTN